MTSTSLMSSAGMGIAETFSLLAMEAEALEEGGFGFNLDIFETNIINLSLVIGILVYFGRNLLGNIMSERRAKIEAAIKDTEKRAEEAASALAEQQQKLAQAKSDAVAIRSKAEENAKAAKDRILAQAEQDIQKLKEAAAQDLSSQQERIIAELRQRAVGLAMQKVESDLQGRLDGETQQRLIDRSIALLGGRS